MGQFFLQESNTKCRGVTLVGGGLLRGSRVWGVGCMCWCVAGGLDVVLII